MIAFMTSPVPLFVVIICAVVAYFLGAALMYAFSRPDHQIVQALREAKDLGELQDVQAQSNE